MWGILASAVLGAAASSSASKKAAKSAAAGQASAEGITREQLAQQQGQYEELLKLGEPYRAAGAGGLAQYEQYTKDPSAMYEDPAYKGLVEQGTRAVEGSAAARGTQLSGRTLQAVQEKGQQTASQYRGQIMGELANLANIGSTSVGQAYGVGGQSMAQQGQAMGNLATLAQQSGQIQAGAQMGQGAALTNLAGTLGSAYIKNQ